MIIEISIENYLSIKNKTVFSLDSSSSKKLDKNLILFSNKERLLKSAVIYGANASGKSNILKAIFHIWFLVKNSHSFNIDIKLNKISSPRIPFKLDRLQMKKPSKFELLFICEGVKYKYGFSSDDEKIIDEYLYYWPQGRESLIFSRNGSEFVFRDNVKQQKIIEKQMNKNVLYLSRATQLGFEKTKIPYEFIVNDLIINIGPSWSENTIKRIHEDPKIKKEIIEILQKADFGGIKDIQVEKKKGWKKTITFGKGEFSHSDEEADVYDVSFAHEQENGDLVYFSLNEESLGTQKTLAILGPFFEILEKGKIAFIDELESSLHPNITRFLIKLFHSKRNRKNAQLVFTTHDTTLLDNELFRRDQIYICSKQKDQSTNLKSYVDYDLRETADFEKVYLTGRVGGLPFIDETIFE